MKYCFYKILLFSLCGVALHPSAACQPQQRNPEVWIDSIMATYTGNDRPGATIGIIHNGKLVFQKGYGMADIETGVKNDPKVSYNIASCSKQFTAAIIVTLARQQKLSLTDDIRKYIPAFPDYGKTITIENLLYHTSGLRDYMVLMWLTGKSFEESFSNKDAMEIITRQTKLNFSPGQRCVYSNSNYLLLAEIVHDATGMTLAEYAQRNLFKNSGMVKSGYINHLPHNKIVKATSYSRTNTIYSAFKNEYAAFGDGGLLTTLSDLAQWDQQFYDDSSPVSQILTPGQLENGTVLHYGMGIMINTYRNEKVQSHPGAFLGFRSEMLRFPERKITILCLGNSEAINPESLTRAIADVYVFGDKMISHKNTLELQPSPEQASAITGIYEVAPNILIEICYENGQLTGQAAGQPRQHLSVDEGNFFKIGTTSDRVTFENMRNDRCQQLTVHQQQGKTSARRVDEISAEDYVRFAGQYYCGEQDATYDFFIRDGNLWFKVESNPEVKACVIKSYNRIYFSYQNLERATIDFMLNDHGNAVGFVLNSGRIAGMEFVRK